jgi:hypothetical protein
VAPLIEYTGTFHGQDYVPLDGAGWPLPGVAIRPDPRGGAPFVMLTNGRQDKFAYAFSPQNGFSEVARSLHLRRWFTTPPVVLPNGDTVTGTRDGYLTRTGANYAQLGAIGGLGTLTAAPTRLANGALVIVSREGLVSLLRPSIVWQHLPGGESIASAAASCNHVFVATTERFLTFVAKNMLQVAEFVWVGGGLHAPVIGPWGHVYAIASNTLYTFAPPWSPIAGTQLPSCAVLPPLP